MNSERLNLLLEQLENDGDDPFILYAVAMEYLSANDQENVESYLQKVRAEFPDYLPVYYQLAKLLDDQDRVDEAIAILKEGMRLAKKENESKTLKELEQYLANLLLE